MIQKKTVHYPQEITTRFGNEWIVEDQRFASTRLDLVVYESEPLTEGLTISIPININLIANTSATDADFIVNVMDVFPNYVKDPVPRPQNIKMGGYQMLLRGDPIRAKFRNSLEKPEPMVPTQRTALKYNLKDTYHTFKKGHRIMVQIQSTLFPMIDLNPGKFVDLFNDVKESNFQKINQKIYHDDERKSSITFGVYKK